MAADLNEKRRLIVIYAIGSFFLNAISTLNIEIERVIDGSINCITHERRLKIETNFSLIWYVNVHLSKWYLKSKKVQFWEVTLFAKKP